MKLDELEYLLDSKRERLRAGEFLQAVVVTSGYVDTTTEINVTEEMKINWNKGKGGGE